MTKRRPHQVIETRFAAVAPYDLGPGIRRDERLDRSTWRREMTSRTMLQFDYEKVHGETVTAVLGVRAFVGSWWIIAIQLGANAVVIRVDNDTDQISVSLDPWPPTYDGEWEPIASMSDAIGAALGWCWVGRNCRGYLDMFTISFAAIEPQFCFVGEASALTIMQLTNVS